MQRQDQRLTCVRCGEPFIVTTAELEFYAWRQYRNAPRKCRACRVRLAIARGAHETVCSECGQPMAVPFIPTPRRAVFCGVCITSRRQARGKPTQTDVE